MSRSILSCAACSRRAVRAFGIPQHGAPVTALPFRSARSFTIEAATPTPTPTPSTSTSNPITSADAPRTLEDLGPEDLSIAKGKAQQRLERAVNKHLERLDDPWNIGKYVEQALERGAFDEALLLVQKASRAKQVVVAWNHLIDYQLKQDRIKDAVKLFNEMKKRQQLPNDRTFTVMFRGMAKSKNAKKAVAEAVKHYNLLLKDKRLETNEFHLNSVLNVCARANDLDSLFTIADTINDGSRAPTAYTYTTIFNALRHNVLTELKTPAVAEVKTEGGKAESPTPKIEKLIERARGLWKEVMDKWTQGKLNIDEELVCAVGRIHLMAPKAVHKAEVLDILQEAMNIPNLVKNPEASPYTDTKMQDIASKGTKKKPVFALPNNRRVTYAVPGTNTLALVLNVLTASASSTNGIKYWNLMVRHYGLDPDENNWHSLFHMLRAAKASAHASSMLEVGAVPDKFLGPKYFRLAMETCVRDNINQNAVKNSIVVLDYMLQKTNIPDMQVLGLHLRVALVSHANFRSIAARGKAEEAKRLYGVQITEALGRLWEPYRQLSYHFFNSTPRPKTKDHEQTLYNNKQAVIALARYMYSAFNKVINEQLLPDSEMADVRKTTAQLNREIQSFYSNRGQHTPEGTVVDGNAAETDEPLLSGDQDEFNRGRQGADFVWHTLKEAPRREPRTPRETRTPSTSRPEQDYRSSRRPSASDQPRSSYRSHQASQRPYPSREPRRTRQSL